ADPKWELEEKKIYQKRLEEEIEMIIKTGFAGYFLIVADFIGQAKDRNIPVGPGRGSGAGSLVAYALDITNINPIPFNLLFERFINPERISLPDFDIDFCQNRRQEVIEYVTQKYGQERVAQIVTFGTLKAKAVVKDVARVFDLSFAESNYLTKLIPDELGITLEKALAMEPKLNEMIESDPKIRQIFNIAKKLEGLFRHAGVHAAGIIITNEPLLNYCPLMKGKEGERVVQFDKNFAEEIGLVKFDFLGLKTLTVIDQAMGFIRRDSDPKFDIEEIDLEDPKVFEFISKGETIGVFQLESSGMIDLCRRIEPNTLDDLTAINALYRPGPLESGMVDDFIEIKHGRKKQTYPFPELGPVLKDTYGVIVYQEQVMNIARIIANYTLGQADMLRRAMGKKKEKDMQKHREIFLKGAEKNKFDLAKAGDLYDLMANFAAYGFNKSHAVAYALIAYQTAFLKYYYSTAFFAALLTSEISNTDKITTYINDAKHFGIEVLPPDVNESLWHFNVIDKAIRFGMGAVKNVGEGAVREIIRVREESGAIQGLIDFVERVDLQNCNRKVLESLIKVGAFDKCEKMNRKTLLENLDLVMAYGQKRQEEKEGGQVSLFEMDGVQEKGQKIQIQVMPDFESKEKLQYEAELIGVYVSGHPLGRYADVITQLASMEISKIHQLQGSDKRDVTLAGMITSAKTHICKSGDKMCFATLEDLSGKIECIVFPKTYKEFSALLESTDPLLVFGQVNLAEGPRKLFPSKIQKLKEGVEERVSGVRVVVNTQIINTRDIDKFKQVLLG
ncbi:MAG: DNA polymerase III subunit alpha, partial [Pseudomonadota bacterium]